MGYLENKNYENFNGYMYVRFALAYRAYIILLVFVVSQERRCKIKTTKISSEGLKGNSVKCCTSDISRYMV